MGDRSDWICPETYELTLQAVANEAKAKDDLATHFRALRADYLALRAECEAKDARIAELETNLKALADDWQSPVSVTGKPAFTRGANAYRKQCAHEIRAAIDAGREP